MTVRRDQLFLRILYKCLYPGEKKTAWNFFPNVGQKYVDFLVVVIIIFCIYFQNFFAFSSKNWAKKILFLRNLEKVLGYTLNVL